MRHLAPPVARTTLAYIWGEAQLWGTIVVDYNALEALCNRFDLRARDDQYLLSLARLALYHPPHPDPDPMVQLTRDLLTRYGPDFDPVPHLREAYKKGLQKCHDLLVLQNRSEHGLWIAQVYEVVFKTSLNSSTSAPKDVTSAKGVEET